MIVKVANKVIKHPIELYIPDEQWEEIQNITNKDELNGRLQKLAMAHIAKYGYELGYCGKTKKRVTLKDCMNCGIGQGWAGGAENYNKWEMCKKENIHYQFGPAEPLLRRIKDEKLIAKMEPATKTEKIQEQQTFSNVERDPGTSVFERNTDTFMRHVREKEQEKDSKP